MYVSIPGKLSEIHFYEWLFSNPCGKVLIIVGNSWSPDLRVPHMGNHSTSQSLQIIALMPLYSITIALVLLKLAVFFF